jgi:hypothetical protein
MTSLSSTYLAHITYSATVICPVQDVSKKMQYATMVLEERVSIDLFRRGMSNPRLIRKEVTDLKLVMLSRSKRNRRSL